MENPVNFELRYAAHQQQVARINAEDWQHQAGPAAFGRLRTTLASALVVLAARLAPKDLGARTLDQRRQERSASA
jgi:hypothetical protein